MQIPVSLRVLSSYFDEEIGPGLVQRIRNSPPEHLTDLVERFNSKRVTVPDLGGRGIVGYDQLLLPAHFSSPVSEVNSAKTLLLYHEVALVADPILGWAKEAGAVYCDENQSLQRSLAEAIDGLLPVLPLVEDGSILLIPPSGMIESAYATYSEPPTEEKDLRVFDELFIPDEGFNIEDVLYERQMDNAILSGWDATQQSLYFTLIDPVIAPHTIAASGIPLWEIESLGYDLSTQEGLIAVADYVIDQLDVYSSDLERLTSRVLDAAAAPAEQSDIVRAIKLDMYLQAARQADPIPLLDNKTGWSHLRRRRAHYPSLDIAPAEVHLSLPSPALVNWGDVVALRRDEEIFHRVRGAFLQFGDELDSQSRGLELHDVRLVARHLGDEILKPEVDDLGRRGRRVKALGSIGETMAGTAARYAFAIAAGPLAGAAARPIGTAGFRKAFRKLRATQESAEAGATLLGLLTSEGVGT